ncbi:ATP-binding protein [Streptomyces pathocidini]|uniref:ATP-binding protein n=1 Tax=Streptomyces pathocidini TaxID=1650571 RepID=UPI0033F6826A
MVVSQPSRAGEPAVLREDALDYTPNPRSVSLARRRAARLVREWGHPDLVDGAALLVSELATNALLHGCLRDRLFRVRIALTPTAVRIEVSDPRGERLPLTRRPADDESFGRGLLLVDQLADRWGTSSRSPGPGKTVWAELGTGQPPRRPTTMSLIHHPPQISNTQNPPCP